MFYLRCDSISGALESNLLGPRGGQRGTLVTSQFHLRATSTRHNLAENPDISFVEGSHFFHFSLKKEPKDSALSHTAPHWLLINCILTSESLAAVANKFWLVVLVLEIFFLAVAVDIAGLGSVRQSGSLVCVQSWVSVQALWHLVADHIYKSLKHSLKM